MRDYHQRRSAAAAKDKQIAQPPQPGEVRPARRPHAAPAAMSPLRRQNPTEEPGGLGAHAGMVFGTPTLGNSEGERLCVECEAPRMYARGLCVNCYMRRYMRDRQRQRRLLCVECGEPGTYARGLCRNCYISDLRQRQRSCVECGEPGTYARGLCQNCYMRDLRRQRRMKHHACVVCGVSFLSARRDALYCSPSCRQRRTGPASRSFQRPPMRASGPPFGRPSGCKTQPLRLVSKSKLTPSPISTGGKSILPSRKRPSAVAPMRHSRRLMAIARPTKCPRAGLRTP
jgi:hypothetical protein